MDDGLKRLYRLMERILTIATDGMEMERLPTEALSAHALGMGERYRANTLRLMLEGGLLEGRLVEDEKKSAINISPTLDGLEYLEKLRKRLRNA